jgi:flagellar basal-body rod protein FlgC
MNLFGLMDVSGSALKAERVRAEVVASNMANSETTRTADGTPYKRHHVVFSAEDGSSFGASLLGLGNGSAIAANAPLTNPLRSAGQMMLWPTPTDSDAAPGGVSVTGVMEGGGPSLQKFEPDNPEADGNGYVSYPDINPLTEMVDLMGASRSYGMNASAVLAEKGMLTASMDLLK